jgi:Rieske Fe-S protein
MTTSPTAGMPGRRPVLCGAAALCVTAVGGCAGYGKGRTTPVLAPTVPAPTAPGPAPAPGAQAPAAGVSRTVIATVADLQVGGGVIIADRQLVVTRPSTNEVRVLSAVCTHQGCLVDTVANGTISCPCHGSAFSLAGEVTSGPATRPLPTQQFVVVDGVVTV